MGKWFEGCTTLEDVKQRYHALCKQLHPDCGGSAVDFVSMMAEYNKAFNDYKNVHMNSQGERYEKETSETPDQFSEIINKVIHLDGIKIEIIGSWVWLSGNTYIYKDTIKECGFIWSKSKKAWYYTGEPEHHKRRGHYSMDGLREKWGTQEVETAKQAKIA